MPPLRTTCYPNTKLGLRLGCVWVASGLRLGCVWVVSGLRLGCVWVASGLRLGCVWVASGLRLDFQEKFSLRQKFVKLTGDNNLRGSGTFRRATSSRIETITYVEVARFGVPPLRETITYVEVARFGVPPLRTTCDPNTNLRFQEKFSLRQKFEQLTGDNDLPGSGTFRHATSSHNMLS
ncbi:hypothetical protein V1477_016951 [Vespula maculifrons]|uniref:Uncharacterized protein n=1 Tax=Vespula maculifrons TaxID=7453 RepID=A0ABD2B4P0_VESMC